MPQLECFDLPTPSQNIIPPRPMASPGTGRGHTQVFPACPESIVGHGTRITLLGSGGTLYCSRLMAWHERLRTLQQLGKFGLGLWLGLEFFRAHLERRGAAAVGQVIPPLGSGSGSTAPGRGGRVEPSTSSAAEQQQLQVLERWLLSLLIGYVRSVLGRLLPLKGQPLPRQQAGEAQGLGAPQATAAAQTAAVVSVDLCLLLPGSQVKRVSGEKGLRSRQ